MKAGTTWLFALLDKHPDIFFCDEKEVHFFAQVHGIENPLSIANRVKRFKQFAAAVRPDHYNARWMQRRLDWFARWMSEPLNDDWYVALFKRRQGQKYVADFSNLTALLDDEGWAHVRRVGKEVKVLYILRDPLARLWSHVKFHAEFIGKNNEMSGWNADQYEAFARAPHLWRNNEYGKVAATLKRNIPEPNLKFAFFEDIHTDPGHWLRELEVFLDVRSHEYPQDRLKERINTSQEIPMPHFFPDLFKSDLRRIRQELSDQGLKPPASWAAS